MRTGARPYLEAARAATFALACALGLGAARAQDVPAGDLDLRASQAEAAPDAAAPAADDKPKKPMREVGKLPPTKPYKGAQRLGLRGGSVPNEAPGATPGPTVAAIPAPPPPRRIAVEENPYDPVGERVGDLKLTPYIEQDVGYATNPSGAVGGAKGSAFETTEAGLGLQSDWSRNDLHGQLKAGYTDYFADSTASGPYGAGTLDGRYDVSKELSFDAEGRFNVTREPLSNLGFSPPAGGIGPETTVSTYGATIGGAQKFGDLTLGLHGTFDRTAYGDESIATGFANNLSTDDYNDYGLRARASYRWTDFVSPFVELGVDARRYDGMTDALGYQRDSNGGDVKAGLTLNYSQKLTGEASLGYGERNYQDPRLPNVLAPLIDASLIWSATPLTTVTLKTQSQLQDSVLPGASADITRNYTIEVAHALTRQIKLGLNAGYASDDYVGAALKDHTTTFGASAEYHLSRDIVLKASATRSQFNSSAVNSSYVANVFMLGLRLQR